MSVLGALALFGLVNYRQRRGASSIMKSSSSARTPLRPGRSGYTERHGVDDSERASKLLASVGEMRGDEWLIDLEQVRLLARD